MIIEPAQLIGKKKRRPAVPKFEDEPSKKITIEIPKSEEKKLSIEVQPMRQRDTSAPKVNLDLISQLYKQKVGNEERLAEKKPPRQIGVLDEYDPARPNDYDQVLKQRRKAKSDTTFKNLNEDLSGNKFGKKQAGAPQIMLPNFNELAMMGQQQVFFPKPKI